MRETAAVQNLAGDISLVFVNLKGPTSAPLFNRTCGDSLGELVENKGRAFRRLEMVVLGGGGEMGLLMNKERNALKGAKNGAKGSSAVLCVCAQAVLPHTWEDVLRPSVLLGNGR